MTELASTVLDALQVAHDIGFPHQEPGPVPGGSGGGASTVVVLAGILVTLGAVGALIWVKNRSGD